MVVRQALRKRRKKKERGDASVVGTKSADDQYAQRKQHFQKRSGTSQNIIQKITTKPN